MTAIYQFEIKQRGGKWAPQCQRNEADVKLTWNNMVLMRRKLRCVKIENRIRTVIAKYDPPKVRKS